MLNNKFHAVLKEKFAMMNRSVALVALSAFTTLAVVPAFAQAPPPPPPPPPYGQGGPAYGAPPPPPMAPAQLDQLVSRIALYPDPLLAQVLTASTFWNQTPEAANWANQDRKS